MLRGTAPGAGTEDLLRRHAPQVLGALVRRYGHFDGRGRRAGGAARGAQWPEQGVPDNPRGWLIRVASRRLTDQLRADQARRRREEDAALLTPRDAFTAPPPGESRAPSDDDTLTLLFLCCHPALPPGPVRSPSTLRAVGGLTTAEIARAHLVPEATMGQRISRAKARLNGAPFRQPGPEDRDARLAAVLQVLYLIFNEGYTATSGEALHRADLAREAIRLTRSVRLLLPRDGGVTGLLALMLLTEARSAARTGRHGELIPLDEQDRALWDRQAIAEATALVEEALRQGPAGPYQLQAAIGGASTTRRGAPMPPTGRRSSPCTTFSWAALRSRWPSSGGSWRTRWCMGRRPGWANCRLWRAGCGGTIASTPYGRICWSGRETPKGPSPPTGWPPRAP